jgi:hypothetical protein
LQPVCFHAPILFRHPISVQRVLGHEFHGLTQIQFVKIRAIRVVAFSFDLLHLNFCGVVRAELEQGGIGVKFQVGLKGEK